MTLDSPLLYRPTENLLLPNKRKLYPIKIPNSHQQLRHYISTADPGKIYVAVGRIIHSIEISTGRLEVITIVPFEPKCLTAGLGWIAVGGPDHGDCAFIRLRDSGPSPSRNGSRRPLDSDVDTPLPLDLSSPLRSLPSRLPEVLVHEFGGSIVNAITLHRLPALNDHYAAEDIALLSNNDNTVKVFSLTRQEIVEVLTHPTAMNYAIISPDSKLLAGVGDEHRIYFYRVSPCPKRRASLPEGDKMLCGWEFTKLRVVDLDSDSYHDQCCFTIAFSPSSHLCAVGSQSGIITVFNVNGVLNTEQEDRDGREDIVCVFRSSRPSFEGGAVRSMSFSPRPWDLLVWVEDHGRAGVADVRQAFSRRQIISLDLEDESLERMRVEPRAGVRQAEDSDSESENRGDYPFEDSTDTPAIAQRDASLVDTERQAVRENLTRDLTDRERRIINFLNTAQWASTEEGGHRSPFSSSPPDRSAARTEATRDDSSSRPRGGLPRRRGSVGVSQDTSARSGSPLNPSNSALIPRPTITLTWTESPPPLPRSDSPLETAGSNAAGPSGISLSNGQSSSSSSGNRPAHGPHRARILLDRTLGMPVTSQRDRSQRPRSIPRRPDRPEANTADGQDSTLAAERLRLHRHAVLEENQREQQRRHLRQFEEQQLRRLRESEHPRATPWFRNDPGYYTARERELQRELGVGTAGIGWGEDGHTLYIGTERGIIQYQVDIQDRKTFPGFSWR